MTDVTTSMQTVAADALIDRYIAIWNETDATVRQELIALTWAEDCHYKDPALEGAGREEIDAMTAGFQNAYPDHRFERVGGAVFDEHKLRFGWKLIAPTGETFITGEDACELSEEGLFISITGTFNQP